MQPHKYKSLFEILIFFSLDSNDPGAMYLLRADTVFRAVQVGMAAQNHLLSICMSVQKELWHKGSRERDK